MNTIDNQLTVPARVDKNTEDLSVQGSFLTTHKKNFQRLWLTRARFMPGWLDYAELKWKSGHVPHFHSVLWGWRLFRQSRKFAVVITGSEREAHIFALLQSLLRRKPVPHILLECMWNPPGSRALQLLKRLQLGIELRSISRVIVWSRGQVARYQREFAVASGKFVFVPFHATLYDMCVNTADNNYVFAGGDSNRDYRPLIEAAISIPARIVIAAVSTNHFRDLVPPPNVEIIAATPTEFLRLMGQARVVVIPMRGGMLHSGGHQTYLNAMALGKPVIVADDCGAEDYIEDGVSGFVVRPGDADALRTSILRVLNDEALARALGTNAQTAVRRFTPDHYFRAVFSLADQYLQPVRQQLRSDEWSG